jgi:acetyltransferase
VRLNIPDAAGVRAAFAGIRATVAEKVGPEHFEGVTVQPMVRPRDGYELIIGSSVDPQFGPVLLFGAGGQLVEVFKDRALGLPPLNATLARRMMEQTRILQALKGVRGRAAVDIEALEQLLVRFSRLVVEQPRVAEIDINPLLASPEGLLALDARVVLHDESVPDDRLPRPAIRPYPTQYVGAWRMKDGTPVTIRPIRPEDEPLIARFHQTLSERSVQLRYFHAMKLSARTAHDRLTRVCFNDYDREIALVAEHADPKTGQRDILGVARLSKQPGFREAEFALLVNDLWQNRGLGKELLARILRVAKDERIERVTADILRENQEMQRVCEKLGFTLTPDLEEGVCRAELALA